MILLKPELFQDLNTAHAQNNPDALKKALGMAIRLEHATIPTYLYALYSINPNSNLEIQGLLQSVVVEEMLHMALGCNILNALGGSPAIDDPTLLQHYPGPLPGAVEAQLIVPLSRFSLELVKNTFMVIEEPEKPLHFQVMAVALTPPLTIGQFYKAILKQIDAFEQAGQNLFVGAPARQVTSPFFSTSELFKVTDAKTARQAIGIIVEQGEGTTKSPLDIQEQLAHYYRFAEIFHGKQLVKNPNAPLNAPDEQKFIYNGPAIPFDANGVYPVIENPKAVTYPVGSKARHACDTFNYTYTSLLKSLHQTFNGNPTQLGAGIGLMNSLREQAMGLMTMDLGNGTNAGPSFEYQPTNP